MHASDGDSTVATDDADTRLANVPPHAPAELAGRATVSPEPVTAPAAVPDPDADMSATAVMKRSVQPDGDLAPPASATATASRRSTLRPAVQFDRPPLLGGAELSDLEKVALNVGAFVTFDRPAPSVAVPALFNVQGWLLHHPHAERVRFEVNGKPVSEVHYFQRDDVVADHHSYEATGFEFWVDVAQVRQGASAGLFVVARCGEVVVQKLHLNCRPARSAEASASELVYFIHIPKTGGSAVAQSLDSHREILSTLKVYDEVGCLPPALLGQLSPMALQDRDLVYGHFDHGKHAQGGRPYTYCAILRDPFDFVLSQYYFAKQVRRAPECTSTFSIHEFLLAYPTAFDNAYCRLLCGDVPVDAPVTEAHFHRALETIKRDFFFVGVTERLQESLHQISLRLGVDLTGPTEPVNVTPNSLERANLDMSAFRRRYHPLVRYDLELYDRVLKRFFGYP